MTPWTHDVLAEDLADHLRGNGRIAWTDMQLGPAGSPRPDVYSIAKSFSRPRPLAYEIKVSVADFRADVRSGKWESYLRFACGVTFAVPSGLITRADVPKTCGLMVRHEEGWKTLKAPSLDRMPELGRDVWMKLLMDGIDRESARARVESKSDCAMRASVRQRLGERVARIIADEDRAEERARSETARVEASIETLRKMEQAAWDRASSISSYADLEASRMRCAEELDLTVDATWQTIAKAVRALLRSVDVDREVSRLRGLLNGIRHMATQAESTTGAA